MASELTSTIAPEDIVERVREVRRLRQEEEKARISRELEAVKERFRAERAALIPSDVERKLREYRAAHRPADPRAVTEEDRPRLRSEYYAHAMSLGVDIPAVRRMQADFGAAVDAVTAVRQDGSAEVSEWFPREAEPEAATAAALGYDGSWDEGQFFYTTRPNRTTIHKAQTYFDHVSKVGSHVRVSMWDTDNHDAAVLSWTNGYMRLFTMPFTGFVRAEMFLRGIHSKHYIDTDDEWGSSSCTVRASQYAIGEIYWDWSSPLPVSYLNTTLISQSWTKQEEKVINETPYLTGLGVNRHVMMHSYVWLPAGHTFAVYVGLMNEGNMKLNDVGATVGVDAAWRLHDLRVTAY